MIQRVSVFKWMAAVAGDLHQVSGKEGLTEMVKYFVPPLAREMGDDGAPQEVRDLSQEVAELIKGWICQDFYFYWYSSSIELLCRIGGNRSLQ